MSASRRSAGAAPRLSDDIAADLDAWLTMEEGDDFSFIHPPSVVSSLAQLSARGSRSGGESFVSPPGGRTASLPGSFRGGVGGTLLDMPRGSASPQPAVYLDEDTAQSLCLGIIGSSGRFCVAANG